MKGRRKRLKLAGASCPELRRKPAGDPSERLPSEIMSDILVLARKSFEDRPGCYRWELLNFIAVNRRWRDLIEKDARFWDAVFIDRLSTSEELADWFRRSAQRELHLHFSTGFTRVQAVSFKDNFPRIVHVIDSVADRWDRISLYNNGLEWSAGVLNWLACSSSTSVRTLDFRRVHTLPMENISTMPAVLPRSRLTTLSIRHSSSWISPATDLSSLLRLRFGSVPNPRPPIAWRVINNVLVTCTALTHLHLDCAHFIDFPANLFADAGHRCRLPSLLHLRADGVDRIMARMLTALDTPMLQSVEYRGWDAQADYLMFGVPSTVTSLSLTMNVCNNDTFKAILRRFPRLTILDLQSSCRATLLALVDIQPDEGEHLCPLLSSIFVSGDVWMDEAKRALCKPVGTFSKDYIVLRNNLTPLSCPAVFLNVQVLELPPRLSNFGVLFREDLLSLQRRAHACGLWFQRPSSFGFLRTTFVNQWLDIAA
ncbi:hypothetical protein R3P38DRAFT_2783104 [Favolaschia claudopus]|uniref:F-box domain-containing protein n=1 Tax=Favolaschia claudopus TaxID=2862362 RepID=A0AAW0B2D8_9AGAR